MIDGLVVGPFSLSTIDNNGKMIDYLINLDDFWHFHPGDQIDC